MRAYAELGHVHRTEPCIEYPGYWLVYVDGSEVSQCITFEEAWEVCKRGLDTALQLNAKVSICWTCTESDPRVGEVWFTGFYQHGYFDQFGRYVS
jgi:hypothetical protein